ncbi:hypothetical protein HDU67_005940 [Dinochytrium kinnereticum]|nr:hypothetical protein HDU67_005940 [Dinochytrium kinnereticum]
MSQQQLNDDALKWITSKQQQLHHLDFDDGIDRMLLDAARREATVMAGRMMKRVRSLKGVERLEMGEVSAEDAVRLWWDFDGGIMNLFVEVLREGCGIGSDGVWEFLSVELFLTRYNIPASTYFDNGRRWEYTTSEGGMSYAEYLKILRLFSRVPNSPEILESDLDWTLVQQSERLTDLLACLRKLCGRLGYVKSHSILSIDGDVEEGLGEDGGRFGPHHGMNSLCSNLHLGSYMPQHGDAPGDCVEVLLRDLTGAMKIRLDNIIALDACHHDSNILNLILGAGGKVVGICHGEGPGSFGRGEGCEGAMMPEWKWRKRMGKEKNAMDAEGKEKMFALSLRVGNGEERVLGYTSLVQFGPGKCTVMTERNGERRTIHGAGQDESKFAIFEAKVQALTQDRHCAVSEAMRKFRITEHLASAIFVAASQAPNAAPELTAVIKMLSLKAEVLARQSQLMSIKEVSKLSASGLRKECEARGFSIHGEVDELRTRLTQPRSVAEVFLGGWFSPAMHADTENSERESLIMDRLSVFLKKQSTARMILFKQYGLLCRKGVMEAVFSPTAIGIVKVGKEETGLAGVMIRICESSHDSKYQETVAKNNGRVGVVGFDGPERFSEALAEMVPDASHRGHVMHTAACGDLFCGIIVYASKTQIIRVVLVKVAEEQRVVYLSALRNLRKMYLGWVYAKTEVKEAIIPDTFRNVLDKGWAVDDSTILFHFKLWLALQEIVGQTNRPFPPGERIAPTLVAVWKRIKGGVSAYSRHLELVRARHEGLSPCGLTWMRVIGTMLYNAYHSYVTLHCFQFLQDEANCSTFDEYLKKRDQMDFKRFCHEAAMALRNPHAKFKNLPPKPKFLPLSSPYTFPLRPTCQINAFSMGCTNSFPHTCTAQQGYIYGQGGGRPYQGKRNHRYSFNHHGNTRYRARGGFIAGSGEKRVNVTTMMGKSCADKRLTGPLEPAVVSDPTENVAKKKRFASSDEDDDVVEVPLEKARKVGDGKRIAVKQEFMRKEVTKKEIVNTRVLKKAVFDFKAGAEGTGAGSKKHSGKGKPIVIPN